MSRPLRIEFPDAWYHVMNRARLGQEAFPVRGNDSGFIELLMDASEMFNIGLPVSAIVFEYRQS